MGYNCKENPKNPSVNVITGVTFVVPGYAPVAPDQHFPSGIGPVIQRNGFFGYVKNVRLGLVTENRKYIRELGLRRIIKARLKKTEANHRFTVPVLTSDAREFTELIS